MHKSSWEKLRVEPDLANPYSMPRIDQVWKRHFKVSLASAGLLQKCPIHCINILLHLPCYFLLLLPRTYSLLFSFHSFTFIYTTIFITLGFILTWLGWKFSKGGNAFNALLCNENLCSFPPSCYTDNEGEKTRHAFPQTRVLLTRVSKIDRY